MTSYRPSWAERRQYAELALAQLREALLSWRWNVEEELEEEEEEGGVIALGPLTRVACEVDPSDLAAVRSARRPDGTSRVVVAAGSAAAEEGTNVIMTSAVARRFAAGILNAADECDGFKPLFASSAE